MAILCHHPNWYHLKQAQSFYEAISAPKHPIHNRLMRIPIDSPDLLRVIKEEGKV